MCGIVGYIGNKNAVEIIMSGLHRLEYRGYDSAGVVVVKDGKLDCVKSVGKLVAMDKKLEQVGLSGVLGIGHTRWATHGVPSEVNSHPHFDMQQEIAVVHNGIIENYQELRAQLTSEGVTFRSQTDTETIAHLVRKYYKGNLFEAVKRALHDVEGAYAIGVVCKDNPDVLVAARHGSPLIVGLGDNEAYIASDVPAIMKYTRKVLYIDNGQVCEIRRDGYKIEDIHGAPVNLEVKTVDWDDAAAEKEGYPHFMLKEIFQQPDVIRNTLRGRVHEGSDEVQLADMKLDLQELKDCKKIVIVSCGTAWHAGLVGKYLIEKFAQVPVEVDIASEYRYRDPIVYPNTIVIPVTQSGETADTLEAIRIAKRKGAKVVSIVNVVGSSIARESHGVIYTQAGPEIGVASTKAYTSQITAFSLFTIYLAEIRGTLSKAEAREMIAHLRAIPDKIQWVLDNHETVKKCSQDPKYRDAQSALFLGRNYNFPSALEGALKLKEISYIHAEGYGAGEMKHGPIALVTDQLPVVCIAPQSATYDKMVSNIQEIRARSGIVLSVATVGDEGIKKHSADVIYVPDCYEPFSPIVVAVPLQLLAYYIATNRGCDVDQPRNLAKSVTVE
ncbi:MAG TPA: glutamine--fructose-6-phosphate transaminase (isomerizing) [Candidatus Hydrogenedentes bacterium]|nr:glutamine--fructose-6-phosphate transaminase (isomerizing) [Candidatus Hydrogenedentota bacterium]HOT49571.1 glutamine--fructose-6-phosphate transaminase (isomerizing) [Candidatus Hydrogenedentota bacterium]HOV74172.1 glutamine--fructose-6-phosphate transaminase (isomerizing) [Candidatus Hydrogenedentota bacterium]HPC15711.1 glutamine--fructose-6-phosphate transaminase (isomerizing) [Candidatus Hydrogenedentota bacterium]HRT19665.1 glutamine--fructose-6-phosphate transaminase (isomerizing) [